MYVSLGMFAKVAKLSRSEEVVIPVESCAYAQQEKEDGMKLKVAGMFGLFLLVTLVLTSATFAVMGGQGQKVAYINFRTGARHTEGPVGIKVDNKKSVLLRLDKCGCYTIIIEIEGPTGWWLNLGNSPTNNGAGGDGGTFSYDSELDMHNTQLMISGNDYDHDKCPKLSHPYVNIRNFVNPSDKIIIQVHDGFVRIESGATGNVVTLPECLPGQYARAVQPCIFACGHNRKDAEHNGPNDYTYWLGLNQVVNGSRSGSGVVSATIIYYPGYKCCCGCDP